MLSSSLLLRSFTVSTVSLELVLNRSISRGRLQLTPPVLARSQIILLCTAPSMRSRSVEIGHQTSRLDISQSVFSVSLINFLLSSLVFDVLTPLRAIAFMFVRTAITFTLRYDKESQPLMTFNWDYPLRLAAWEVTLDYFFVRCCSH